MMMSVTNNEINQRNDRYSFSNCTESASLISDSLISLLQHPGDITSSTRTIVPPESFNAPFENPALEPVPFTSRVVSEANDCFSLEQLEPSKIVQVGQNNIPFNIDPINIFSPQEISCHNICSTFQEANQQDVSHLQTAAAEENVARFRPFQDQKWQDSFQRLLEFRNKFGHCCVPHSYTEDLALARWVKRQRHQYKKFKDDDSTSTLTPSRLEQLEAIGFVWHCHAAAWMEKLNELKVFRENKGHCNVPSTYAENVALSTWVKSQRRQYKLYVSGSPSTMTKFRVRVLKSLGFVFEPRSGTSTSKNAGLESQRGSQVGEGVFDTAGITNPLEKINF